MRAVGQPVEGGRGEQRLAEELRPLGPVTIARHNNGRLLIPFVDDVVKILGPWGAQGLEPEVIEHQQGRPRVAREALLMGAVGAATGEMGEHLGGVDEEDLVTPTTRLMGQGLRDVTLAHPGRPVDQDVFVPLDEGARREVKELGLVELGIEAEVEAFERLGGIEGGAPQAQAVGVRAVRTAKMR